MRLHEAHLGHMFAQEGCDFIQIRNAWNHVEALSASIPLPEQGLPQNDGIERRDEGAHRQSVHGRRRDYGHFPHAGKRQLQGARDRRRRQRQHMHVFAQLLEPFFMAHTEMLLLVYNKQTQIPELDGFGQESMRSDHDVDLAVFDPLPHQRHILGRDEPGSLRHPHRIAFEPFAEGLIMLAGQERRWHDNGHLLALHHCNERRSESYFRLADPHRRKSSDPSDGPWPNHR